VNTSDQELLQHLASNSLATREKSWELIYQSFYPLIRNMVRQHNGSEEDAVDVFQDGLLVFSRNVKNGAFRGDSSIKTYLFSICKNLWLKTYYKRQRELIAGSELILEAGDDLEYLKNVESISVLMNELNEDCRNVLIEFYYNNRSMNELKEMFNVNSIQAAKNKKWRCLGCLMKLFKEKGILAMTET
jgi:RNA polymerase sigma factor (sigma-70 family)